MNTPYFIYLGLINIAFLGPLFLVAVCSAFIFTTTGLVRVGIVTALSENLVIKSPLEVMSYALWTSIYDLTDAAFGSIVISLGTPFTYRLIEVSYRKLYLVVKRILLGNDVIVTQASNNQTTKEEIGFNIKNFKFFMLLNGLFSLMILFIVSPLLTQLHSRIDASGEPIIFPLVLLALIPAPLLTSVLHEMKERNFRMYKDFLRLSLGALSITSIISFMRSPLIQEDFISLLGIIPSLYLFNILGISFCVLSFNPIVMRLITRQEGHVYLGNIKLARKTVIASLLFIIPIVFGATFLFLFYAVYIFGIKKLAFSVYLVERSVDVFGSALLVYLLALNIRKIRNQRSKPSIMLLFETVIIVSFMYLMQIHWISLPKPTLPIKPWQVVILLALGGGLIFSFNSKFSVFIVGISVLISTLYYSTFMWFGILIAFSAALISFWVKDNWKRLVPAYDHLELKFRQFKLKITRSNEKRSSKARSLGARAHVSYGTPETVAFCGYDVVRLRINHEVLVRQRT